MDERVTLIDNLVDDCLLRIFDFFDPLIWLELAQVCKRWESLVQTKFKKITDIQMKEPKNCQMTSFGKYHDMKGTNKDTVKTLLQYVGQNVKSFKTGVCYCKSIYLNGRRYRYRVMEYLNNKDDIPMLFQSSKNLKQAIPICTFESVEDATWTVTKINNFDKLDLLFPNMKKLRLNIKFLSRETVTTVKSILRRVSHLKSLTIVFYGALYGWRKLYRKLFSPIGSLSQLEELHVWHGSLCLRDESIVDAVDDLPESCPNLRVVSLDAVGLGTTDFSCFLKLPKLERLNIRKARVFSAQSLEGFETFEKLTRLEVSFSYLDVPLEFEGIFAAIDMMPALKYLSVNQLPKYIVPSFTCSMIKNHVSKKDIVLAGWQNFKIMRVYKTEDPSRTERLTMNVGPQKKEYFDTVLNFLENLEGCSFIIGDTDVGDLFDDYNDKDEIVKECCNVFTVSDGSDSETEENSEKEDNGADKDEDEDEDTDAEEEDSDDDNDESENDSYYEDDEDEESDAEEEDSDDDNDESENDSYYEDDEVEGSRNDDEDEKGHHDEDDEDADEAEIKDL